MQRPSTSPQRSTAKALTCGVLYILLNIGVCALSVNKRDIVHQSLTSDQVPSSKTPTSSTSQHNLTAPLSKIMSSGGTQAQQWMQHGRLLVQIVDTIFSLLHFPANVVPDFPMVLSPEEAEKSGVSADHLLVGPEYGGPGYPVAVEALHQLHCLVNALFIFSNV